MYRITKIDKIAQAITRLFDKYFIAFWYDEKKELRGEYESLWLVFKIDLNNGVKVNYGKFGAALSPIKGL